MVIFDARSFNPPWFIFVILIFLFAIVIGEVYKVYKNKEKLIYIPQNYFIIAGLTILFFTAIFIAYRILIGNNNDLKSLLVNNKCKIIIGKIKSLTLGVDGKSERESFIVNNTTFKYSPADHGNGFNQQLTKNGLAKNGDRIRLCYIKTDWNNAILYFYLFKSP